MLLKHGAALGYIFCDAKIGGQETKKASRLGDAFCRGRERIRTAVRGFADLCLATRPRDQ